MIKSKTLYACPGSGEELNFSDTGFSTADGRRQFPTVDGVPNFLAYPSIEDGEQVQTLIRLNEEARTKGWEPSLRAVYGRSSSIYQYVTDEQRAAFLDLLPLNEQAVVLEIGTGLGQITTPLARTVQISLRLRSCSRAGAVYMGALPAVGIDQRVDRDRRGRLPTALCERWF